MNANQIKAQLAQVFENDYPGYECFVEKVINVIFTGDDAYEAFSVPEDYLTDKNRKRANESGILRIIKVGTIDAEEPIDLFDITLSDKKELQYNRVGIQQFIRSSLFPFTNAFMLFHNETPEGKDWRFSFAYKDTTIKGMTSAKRYTYLFGSKHRARTASERFAKLANEEKTTQNLLDAFSVEALSKSFFNEYKEQYKAFCDYLFAHKDDRECFGAKFSQWEDKYLRDYVKKMMGRITFIYFLQRKGWMNGDFNYMQNAYKNSTCKDDYLDSFLEPLFCGVLNTKPAERIALFKEMGWNLSLLDGWKDIPYLNGGLFERDEQDKPKSKFPAEMFKNLFDFYSSYNFTIYENDPDDAEVGVDPEMLGHIFENLLEDNKDKGAFYTPKEIVQYMSEESISQYLKTHTEEALHPAIDELIKEKKVAGELQEKTAASAVYALLKNVKVCDPAIGSGAFPMGVLNVLYHARMLLYAFTRPTQGFSPAMVKREIIQNNIYGVDIEKGAVDIARLRFWLALVVDEEEPQPLPNLDYKIMCGNSLIHRFALDAPFKDVLKHYNKENKTNITLDDYRQWVYDYTNLSDHTQKDNFRQKIEEIKHAFKTVLSTKEKDKISNTRGEIDNLQYKDIFGNQKGSANEIKKLKGRLKDLEAQRDDIEANKLYENAFEWRFEFPALLDEEGNFTGFDVVIGNPPYVNISNIKPDNYRKKLQSLFYSNRNKSDLYSFFIEKGFSLMNTDGILCYIVPHTWKATDSFKNLREIIFEKHCLTQIVNQKMGVFDAIVNPMIILLKNRYQDDYEIDVFDGIGNFKYKINVNEIKADSNWAIDSESSLEEKLLFKSIEKCKYRLSDVIDFSRGIKTSNDKRFVSNTCENKDYKKVYRGRNIKAYSMNWANEYIWYRPDLMREKVGCLPHTKEFFEVPEKIVTQRVNSSMQLLAAYDDQQNYFLDTTNVSNYKTWNKSFSLKFVCGILNSKVVNYWYPHKYKMPTIGGYELSSIPIPEASKEQQQPIIDLVDKILVAKKENPQADTSGLEKEIDEIVYHLYGLTYDEVLVVDPETKITREEYKATII